MRLYETISGASHARCADAAIRGLMLSLLGRARYCNSHRSPAILGQNLGHPVAVGAYRGDPELSADRGFVNSA